MNLDKELGVAKQAALEAGEAILEIYKRDFTFREKANSQGPVTEADLLADKIICEILRNAFPDDGIISEERDDDIIRFSKKRVWCIDPLDGTKDFLMKNGEFAVHIGLIINGVSALGVVYLPVFKKLYYGSKDYGAFVDFEGKTKELKTNNYSALPDMTMVASRSHRTEKLQSFFDSINFKQEIVHGSVGAKIALIMEGQADFLIYFSSFTKEWDICAPEAILKGAGGKVSDIIGNEIKYNKKELNNPWGILASNGSNHQVLLDSVKSFQKR